MDPSFPPYAYLPGRRPHPRRDPGGHSVGIPEPAAAGPLDPAGWQGSALYRRGVALFDRGYYWEAHEAWEALWIAAGRAGPIATLLQGLIKLAAAGIKLRQGRRASALGLAAAAEGVFIGLEEADPPALSGVEFGRLRALAAALAGVGPEVGRPELAVEVVFPLGLAAGVGME